MKIAIQSEYLTMTRRLGYGNNCCVCQIHWQVFIRLHQSGGTQPFRYAQIKQN